MALFLAAAIGSAAKPSWSGFDGWYFPSSWWGHGGHYGGVVHGGVCQSARKWRWNATVWCIDVRLTRRSFPLMSATWQQHQHGNYRSSFVSLVFLLFWVFFPHFLGGWSWTICRPIANAILKSGWKLVAAKLKLIESICFGFSNLSCAVLTWLTAVI